MKKYLAIAGSYIYTAMETFAAVIALVFIAAIVFVLVVFDEIFA